MLLHPGIFQVWVLGVGWHFLLQRIFPTQGLNPGLPHCRQTLYHLSHQGILHTKCHTMKSQWLCLPFFRSYAGTLVPRWLSGKKSTCQSKKCRRHPLDSWVGKIPWRRKWQSTTIFLPRKSCGLPRRAGWATVHRVTKSQTRLSDWANMHSDSI